MKQTHFTTIGTEVRQTSVYSKLLKTVWLLPLFVAIAMLGCQKDSSTVHLNKAASSSILAETNTANPAPINLGSGGDFTILSETGISTTGVTSITGDIGVSPIAATAITGFGLIKDPSNQFSISAVVNGKIYAANYAAPTPSKMTTAVSDIKTAFVTASGLTTPAPIVQIYAGDLSGRTLPSGLYKWSTGVLITNAGVTLSGSANDVWVFQIAQNLTVDNSAIIHLAGGAQAKNIFWIVSGKATLGTSADFSGNILSKTLISLNTGAKVNGRLYAQTAVTLIASTVSPNGQATVSPSSGIVYSSVTISGSNFSATKANDVVKFNGVTAVVNSATSTQIVATVPLGATSGEITVVANGDTSSSVANFQVLQIVQEGSMVFNSNYTIGSMAGDKSGNVYGTASDVASNGTVANFVFKYSNGAITHIYDSPAGSASLGLYTLSNLVVDAQGNINVAQNYTLTSATPSATTKILNITPAGAVKVLTGGSPGIRDSGGSNTTEYTYVYSMVGDPAGNLYAATTNELKKITPAGVVTTVADFNPNGAKYMATDTFGDLYYWSTALVNNVSNYSVKKVTPQGVISTIFTQASPILSIITDASNNVFVSTGSPADIVYIINQAGAVNGHSFADGANSFLTDNNGNFYTVASSAITKYIFK